MPEPIFRVGVLGATGFIGAPYRAEIRECESAGIVALCARRQDLLGQAAAEDGAALATADWREVVGHPDVNFVVVATPDAFHHEAMLACARQGKHVLCEKPVGMNVAEAEEIWHAYRDHELRLAHFVPLWTRYVEVFRKAKEIVASGALGEIRSTIFRWHNPRPAGMALTWRDDPALSSAGTIADVGSHAYDAVRWIIGEAAASVIAHGETLTPLKADIGAVNLGEAIGWGQEHAVEESASRQGGTVDYATVNCRFAGGAVGTFVLSHATYLRKHLAPELELHGTQASLSVDRYSGDVVLVGADQVTEVIAKLPDVGFGNRFEKFVFPALAATVIDGSGGDGAHPDLEDGLLAQRFTDAALASVKEGRWVDVG